MINNRPNSSNGPIATPANRSLISTYPTKTTKPSRQIKTKCFNSLQNNKPKQTHMPIQYLFGRGCFTVRPTKNIKAACHVAVQHGLNSKENVSIDK